jgi:arginine/ornithine N-succinyltransferase beta subunit
MTLTETNFPARDRLNDRLVREVQYTGPASYATGGESVNAAADLGMGEVYGVYGVISDGTGVRVPWLNYTTQKILWFIPNTGVQVANAVDLSTFSGTLLFHGKG